MKKNNIFENIAGLPQNEELFEIISQNEIIKIERIISTGQSTEEGQWYEQKWNEFVILLKGSAVLSFDKTEYSLKPGDYFDIPAMTRHRVESTDKTETTIWLAVHYRD